MNVLKKFKPVRTFVFDVDGVLTDGSLLVLDDGQQARRMNIKDGYALQLAVKKGYQVLVISGSVSEAVRLRLSRLGLVHVFQGVEDKKKTLFEFAARYSLHWDELLFMGDDIPDLAAMQLAGLRCCPSDAVMEIKQIADYISPLEGGKGCARDVIEKVLKLNDHWQADTGIASR